MKRMRGTVEEEVTRILGPAIADGASGLAPATARLRRGSHLPVHHGLLDLGDGLRGVKVLGAGLGAVEDGVAAVEPERIFEVVEPVAGRFVARILDPALRL